MIEDEIQTQFRDAVWESDLTRISNLLQTHKVLIDKQDEGGQTPLHLAAFWGKFKVVQQLISAGASIHIKNSAQCTPLDLAIHWGHTSVAEYIRMKGGSSAWEERLSRAQLQIEELKNRVEDIENEKKLTERLLKNSREECVERAKSYVALENTYLNIEALKNTIQIDVVMYKHRNRFLQDEYEHIRAKYSKVAANEAKILYAQHQIQLDRDAIASMLEIEVESHRQDITARDVAHQNWQIAERAASEADSARNRAFIERDKLKKELVELQLQFGLLQENYDKANNELQNLKVEAREFLLEKRKAQTKARRAERMLDQVTDEVRIKGIEASREFTAKLRAQQKLKQSNEEKRFIEMEKKQIEERHEKTQRELAMFQKEFVRTVQSFAELRAQQWDSISHQQPGQEAGHNNQMERGRSKNGDIKSPLDSYLRQSSTAGNPYADCNKEKRVRPTTQIDSRRTPTASSTSFFPRPITLQSQSHLAPRTRPLTTTDGKIQSNSRRRKLPTLASSVLGNANGHENEHQHEKRKEDMFGIGSTLAGNTVDVPKNDAIFPEFSEPS